MLFLLVAMPVLGLMRQTEFLDTALVIKLINPSLYIVLALLLFTAIATRPDEIKLDSVALLLFIFLVYGSLVGAAHVWQEASSPVIDRFRDVLADSTPLPDS